MIRLLHLSDVHFGRDRVDLMDNLIVQAHTLRPDATILSGDLTQRARPSQFAAAMGLMEHLPRPHLIVPGNHDIPMDRPWERLFSPWKAYTQAVGPDRSPCLDLPGVRLVGINTAIPWSQQRGAIGASALATACSHLHHAPPGALRVVVLHHPLAHPAHGRKPALLGRRKAARALIEGGADLFLSGHIHHWDVTADLLITPQRSAISVSCGTSLSTRVRDQGNDYAVLDLEPTARRITITRWSAGAGSSTFTPHAPTTFLESPAGWRPVPTR